MIRRMCMVAAVVAAAAIGVIPAPAMAQAPGTPAATSRALAAISQKRAGCKRQATAQKLDLSERRAFMRRCLRP